MKSSVKNKVNFGLVEWFKNTKLGKWLVKVKLFFIRIVAHSKNPPLCDKSDVIKSQYFKSGIVENQKINPEFQKAIDNIFISVDELTKLDKILTQIKDNKHLFKKHGFTLIFSDGEETQHLI